MTCSRAMRAAPSTPQRTDSTDAPSDLLLDEGGRAPAGRRTRTSPRCARAPSPNLLVTRPPAGTVVERTAHMGRVIVFGSLSQDLHLHMERHPRTGETVMSGDIE